jgi:hypothetical protein
MCVRATILEAGGLAPVPLLSRVSITSRHCTRGTDSIIKRNTRKGKALDLFAFVVLSIMKGIYFDLIF